MCYVPSSTTSSSSVWCERISDRPNERYDTIRFSCRSFGMDGIRVMYSVTVESERWRQYIETDRKRKRKKKQTHCQATVSIFSLFRTHAHTTHKAILKPLRPFGLTNVAKWCKYLHWLSCMFHGLPIPSNLRHGRQLLFRFVQRAIDRCRLPGEHIRSLAHSFIRTRKAKVHTPNHHHHHQLSSLSSLSSSILISNFANKS